MEAALYCIQAIARSVSIREAEVMPQVRIAQIQYSILVGGLSIIGISQSAEVNFTSVYENLGVHCSVLFVSYLLNVDTLKLV